LEQRPAQQLGPLVREVAGRAFAVRLVDGDVEAGVADGVVGAREAARVAELGQDRRRAHRPHPVQARHQRAAAGLAAGEGAQLSIERRQLSIGADSLIEALAGGVVLWLFTGKRRGSGSAERRAQQLIAVSFFLLAAYVGVEALRTLVNTDHPNASWVGIGLAAFTAPTMPLLAYAKRRLGNQLHSSATVKEAAQTQLCAYLSIALLLGLGANALAGWWWADPLAALAIAAVALKEGRESWRGEGCCDAC